jgi:hypothetical protein
MSRERTTRFGDSGEGNYESPGSLHLKHRNTAISALVLLVVYSLSTIGASALPGHGHLTKMGRTAPGSTNTSLALPHDGVIIGGKDPFGVFTPQPASSDPNGLLAKHCPLFSSNCPPWRGGIRPAGQLLFLLWQAMPLIAASPKGINTDMSPDTGPLVQVRAIRGRVESLTMSSSQQLQVN